MFAALVISVALLVTALGFFAFALSSLQRMLREKQQTEDRLVDSERHLQSIIDNATGMIFVTDLEERLMLVNRAFESALRVTRADVIGKTPDQLFSPPIAEALMRCHDEAVESIAPLEYDLEINFGEPRSYLGTRFALGDSAGRPYALCCVLTDVTERKRAAQERLRIFDLSLDLMCVTTFDGYQSQTNPQFEKILGYTIEEMQSRPFFELVHPDDLPSTRAAVERMTRGENLVDFVNRAICKDGSVQWLSWRVSADLEQGLMFAVARPMQGPPVAEGIDVPDDSRSAPAAADGPIGPPETAEERIVSLREVKAKRDTH